MIIKARAAISMSVGKHMQGFLSLFRMHRLVSKKQLFMFCVLNLNQYYIHIDNYGW